MGYMNLGSMLIQPISGLNQTGEIRDAGTSSQDQSFNKKLSEMRQNIQSNRLDYKPANKSVKDNNRRQNQDLKTNNELSENKKVEVEKDNSSKDTSKVSKEIDTKPEKTNTNKKESELPEEVDANEVDEQILMLVSQSLNMPIEEVMQLLSEFGMEVQDLLSQESFGMFVAEALGAGNMEFLLTKSDDLSKVTQLFEHLTQLRESMSQDEMLSGDLVALQEQIPTLVENEAIQTVQKGQVGMEPLSEVKAGKEQLIEESKNQLSFLPEGETTLNSVGEQIPVHHFTSAQVVQNFQTSNGTVMQTITSKVSGSGETFIEQIDFKVIGQTKELNVQMSPKELGQLNIKIVEHNGSLVAEIKVDNEKAKDFILNEIHLLKERLEGEGLNVSDVKVDIRQDQRQSQMEQEKQKSSKRIQEIISKHFDEVEEEQEESPVQILTESEVDYMV